MAPRRLRGTVLLFAFSLCFTYPLQAQWVPTNGPYGGNIYSLLTIGSTLLAGSDGRIFQSTDLGTSWASIGDGVDNFSIYALATNGSTLFTGYYIAGIYRSTDAGANWAPANNGISGGTNANAFATIGSTVFAATDIGVCRSTDNGLNWTNVGLTRVNTIFSDGTNLYTGDYNGAHRSTDNGNTWTDISNGLSLSYFFGLNCYAMIEGFLYAGTADGVFVSLDKGTTWIATSKPAISAACLFANGTTLFAATPSVVYRSSNGGQTWIEADTGLPGSYRINAFTAIGTTLFAATKGAGVYRSTDNGSHWTPANKNMASVLVLTLATSGPYLCAGTGGSGIFRTSNNGATWSDPVTTQGIFTDMNTTYCFASKGNSLFAGINTGVDYSTGHGVFRSDDNGSSWSETSDGISGTAILSLASSGSIVYAGSAGLGANDVEPPGLFESYDNGAHWQKILTIGQSSGVQCMLMQGNTVFAGTAWEGVQMAGQGSGDASSGLPNNPDVYSLVQTNKALFAALGGDGIYRSTNGGNEWTASGYAASFWYPVYGLATDGKNLFAATAYGVCCSTDQGISWQFAGLKNKYVHQLLVVGNELYAAVMGDVVYHTSIANAIIPLGVTGEKRESTATALTIYPNPMSSSATITLACPERGYAEISLVNLLGAEVANVFSGELEAGQHTYELNAARMAAPRGEYHCLVRMNGRVMSQPVVIER